MTRRAFLGFCEDFTPISYSQRYQDLFGLWIAGLRPTGYFVEFGALAGINVSNSYLMERLGWTGIVAEPHPDFADRLRANRSAHVVTDCVWSHSGQTVTFHAVKGKPALSTIGGLPYDDIQNASGARDAYVAHDVPTISLLDMLQQANAPAFIDYLSIDTEGSELTILEAFDFSAHRFGAIVVEHGFSSQRDPIHALLTDHGYVRLWPELSGHDDWYVHAAHVPDAAPDVTAFVQAAAALPEADKAAQRLRMLSEMAGAAGETDLRLRAAVGAAAGAPGSGAAQSELAQAYAEAGLIHQAIRAYDRALDINPSLGPARRRRARLLSRGAASPST